MIKIKKKQTYEKPMIQIYGDIKDITQTKETRGNFDSMWDEAS